MDTLFKVTAVLGVLAWLPQIIKWVAIWDTVILFPKVCLERENKNNRSKLDRLFL